MNRQRAKRREAGFSLVEVLIGGLIFLVVVIGILPLFTRAIVDNTAGNDYTQVSNMAKSGAEEAGQSPFNSTAMTVPSGQSYLETKQIWNNTTQQWAADTGATPTATTSWRRTTRVRQYSLSDLTENTANPVFDHPLPGGTEVTFVHLKELEIQVQNVAPQQALGVRRQFSMRVMKPF